MRTYVRTSVEIGAFDRCTAQRPRQLYVIPSIYIFCMRAQDMRLGQSYTLLGSRSTVVVLETPPQVRRQARTRVRLEGGVKAGEEIVVPSRRILAPLGGPLPRTMSRSKRKAAARKVQRSPRVGDLVTWKETGPLSWTVDALDKDSGRAAIRGAIFEQPMERSVSLDELELCPSGEPELDEPTILDALDDPSAEIDVPASRFQDQASSTDRLRPEKPRRQLDELLDDILFSPRCLAAYSRRYAQGVRGPSLNEHLRDEIRRKGFVIAGGVRGSGEYARLRVPRRFDVVLRERPSPEEPASVTGLHFVPQSATRRRKRRRSGTLQRRAA